MKKLLFALLLMFACDGGPTIPDPVSNPDPDPAPIVMPRVDVQFEWHNFQGFTAFALGHPIQTEEDVRGLYADAMSHGWNTGRICAETEFWDGNVDFPVKPRDLDRLDWTLDVIARIPGAQVLLIGDCTLKGPVPEPEKREWARGVAKVAARYKNVAIETHNEFDNCRGRGWGPHCPGKEDVRAHVAIYRAAGIRDVTADDSVCAGPREPKTYVFRLANIGARPADFHPCREHGGEPWDPSFSFLEQLSRFNSGEFVLSETVAWMDSSGRCSGLRTCDKERIQSFVDRCSQVSGCYFTFHSEALLAGEHPTWWPEAR